MIVQRTKRNSSKINLTISFIFHGLLILVVFFFAAREGLVGKKLKQLAVTMVPKEKKPEPPKEKPAAPKPETAKADSTPKMAIPQPKMDTAAAPPPSAVDAAPSVAPAAASLPAFEFSDGAKAVQTISDPNGIYKALIEHSLRSRWNRPEDMADETYVAEVEISVDAKGKVTESRWLKGSGNKRWDDSVKEVIAQTRTISRPPPKGFPQQFPVRFDVETSRTEPVIQLSSQ
ncbi:MAG: TonB family protein [Verrucomicrobiota bacterium]